ncbi:hypothetical protein ACCO45_013974 [Purpureocillium lilacinum]|uniref:Uncharacterized protein n=1 Tax=Purpureocillium lilacinum TaxID=33203 RepID=A0ACC4D866_PURLI
MRDPCKCLTRTAIIPHVLPGSYPVSHTSTHKPQKRPRFVESTSGTAPERASTRHSWSAGRIRGWLSAPPPWPLGAASECWRLGSGDHGFRASVRRRAVAGGFKTATGEFLPAGVPAIQRRELPAQYNPLVPGQTPMDGNGARPLLQSLRRALARMHVQVYCENSAHVPRAKHRGNNLGKVMRRPAHLRVLHSHATCRTAVVPRQKCTQHDNKFPLWTFRNRIHPRGKPQPSNQTQTQLHASATPSHSLPRGAPRRPGFAAPCPAWHGRVSTCAEPPTPVPSPSTGPIQRLGCHAVGPGLPKLSWLPRGASLDWRAALVVVHARLMSCDSTSKSPPKSAISIELALRRRLVRDDYNHHSVPTRRRHRFRSRRVILLRPRKPAAGAKLPCWTRACAHALTPSSPSPWLKCDACMYFAVPGPGPPRPPCLSPPPCTCSALPGAQLGSRCAAMRLDARPKWVGDLLAWPCSQAMAKFGSASENARTVGK